jgi:hypothetical protein
MSSYSDVNSIYDTFTYGEQSKLSYTVTPFTASAIDYKTVKLQWITPSGTVSRVRIVRSQDGFPENPEDGVILFDNGSKSSVVAPIYDGTDPTGGSASYAVNTPLKSGRFSYYSYWLQKSDSNWYLAGRAYTLVPAMHNSSSHWASSNSYALNSATTLLTTHDKFMDLLPRIFSSNAAVSLDDPDAGSDLYRFLKGFSITLDEFMTYVDMLLPDHTERFLSPNLLMQKIGQYGIDFEPTLGIRNQKRMIRDGIYIHQNRGTLKGINAFVEAFTGLPSLVTVSLNSMLSTQDSTFYQGIGNWLASGTSTIAATNAVAVKTPAPTSAIDVSWTGLVTVATASDTVSNGADAPITKGVPVVGGTAYGVTFNHLRGTGTGTITPSITWYDYKGSSLGTTTGTAITTASTWTQTIWSSGVTAPGKTVFIVSATRASNVATVVLPSGHGFVTGNTITIKGTGQTLDTNGTYFTYDGTYTVTVSGNNMTFTSSGYNSAASTSYTTATASSPLAAYASLSFAFSGTGTYYLDMIQFADFTYSTGEYSEARAVNVTLGPNKTNLVVNPAFANSSNWTLSGITPTWQTTGGYLTSTYLTAVSTTTNATVSAVTPGFITPGGFYTFSAYVKTNSGTAPVNLTISVVRSSDNAVLATKTLAANATATTTWTRQQINLNSPYSGELVYLQVSVVLPNSGTTVNISNAQLERAFAATDYLDGNIVAVGVAWDGTTNASYSTLYYNKGIKYGRLSSKIVDEIPFNTPWILWSGVTKKVIEAKGIS